MLLFICCREDSGSAGIAQSVVRRIGSAEVTSSILVASFESNHENHFVYLYCGYFLVTTALKVIKKVIKKLGSSAIGNCVDDGCLIFYALSVPVIVFL